MFISLQCFDFRPTEYGGFETEPKTFEILQKL